MSSGALLINRLSERLTDSCNARWHVCACVAPCTHAPALHGSRQQSIGAACPPRRDGAGISHDTGIMTTWEQRETGIGAP